MGSVSGNYQYNPLTSLNDNEESSPIETNDLDFLTQMIEDVNSVKEPISPKNHVFSTIDLSLPTKNANSKDKYLLEIKDFDAQKQSIELKINALQSKKEKLSSDVENNLRYIKLDKRGKPKLDDSGRVKVYKFDKSEGKDGEGKFFKKIEKYQLEGRLLQITDDGTGIYVPKHLDGDYEFSVDGHHMQRHEMSQDKEREIADQIDELIDLNNQIFELQRELDNLKEAQAKEREEKEKELSGGHKSSLPPPKLAEANHAREDDRKGKKDADYGVNRSALLTQLLAELILYGEIREFRRKSKEKDEKSIERSDFNKRRDIEKEQIKEENLKQEIKSQRIKNEQISRQQIKNEIFMKS